MNAPLNIARRLLPVILWGLVLGLAGPLRAQDAPSVPGHVTGTVKDTDGDPLVAAQVILTEGAEIRGYTLAGATGEFDLPLPARLTDSASIEVRMFGFASFRTPLPGGGKPLRVTLTAEGVEMETVEISASALPMSQREDTLMFSTASYTDGTEEKVEDVLKKLPGVEVNEEGQVTVQGQAIDRVLVDGDDAFGRNYRLATKNISAGFVDRIDVIANYTDDELTGDLQANKELVLNLNLSNGKKGILFGETELSLSPNGATDNNLNAFYIRGKVKAIAFGQNNTVGQDPSSGMDLSVQVHGNVNSVSRSDRPDLLSPPNAYRPRSINSREYLRNEVYATAGSLLFTPSKKFRSRTIYSVDNNLYRLNNQERINQFNERAVTTIENFNFYRESHGKAWVDSRNELRLGKATRVDVNLIGKLGHQDALADLTTTVNGAPSALLTSLDGSPHQFRGSVRLTRRLSPKTALRFVADGSRERNDQTGRHLSGRYQSVYPDASAGIQQNAREERQEINPHLELLVTTDKYYYTTNAGYRYTRGDIFATSSAVTPNGNIAIDGGTSSLGYDFSEIYLAQSASRTWSKFNVSAGGTVSGIKLGYASAAYPTESTYRSVVVQPNLEVLYKMSKRQKFTFSASSNRELPAPNQLVAMPYFVDYQTITQGVDTLYLQRIHSVSLRYAYNNAFRQLSYFAHVQRTSIPNGLRQRIAVEDLFTEQSSTAGFGSSSMQLRAGISKFSGSLHGTVSLKAALMEFNNRTIINDQPFNNRYRVVTADIRYLASWGKWLKTSVESGVRRAGNPTPLTEELITNTTWSFHYGAQLTATPVKPLLLSINATNYRWYQGREVTNTTLVGLHTSYRFGPSLKVNLRGYNLLNQGTFYQNYITSYQVSRRSFQLRSRTLLAGITWTF